MDTASPDHTPPGAVVMCPPTLDADALAKLREDFGGDWDIGRTPDGRLTAEHLHEEPDARREMWVIKTRVVATTAEEMHIALCIQQAVRGAENR